ncbi:uncharacterized protein MONOS_18602 [Monocercomonoides exilis]|uniref:uncharacterized protein n=1 Tax=Monocercomonoides exilis TaxID=2049356 RepID=UPI00355A40A2|nr:hypothetical protein MONOS_18602 [Monocercomonoides exilis]
MMIDESEKKEEKDEKLLVNLCECFSLLNVKEIPDELIPICVTCLLKATSEKQGNEETQKEMETAILTLSYIARYCKIEKKLYLNEIKKIIKCNQEHHNMTQLAYQSAWKFLICRFVRDESLEEVVVDELHFAREAIKELEELAKCVDWKSEKEKEKRKKEKQEELILLRWLRTLNRYFRRCKLWNEEYSELIGSIVQIYRASRDNYRDICHQCIYYFVNAAENRAVKVDDLLKGRAVDTVLEEMQLQTLNKYETYEFLLFCIKISRRLKEEEEDEAEEAKRKINKRRVFEMMEEEGYEDVIVSFYGKIYYIIRYSSKFTLNISDYLVNI